MKTICLTQGKVALVDDTDFEWISRHKWYAMKTESGFYAARDVWIRGAGRKTTILMHRLIIDANPKDKVDPRDHNGLNNRRRNLRIATTSQNNFNARLSSANTSGLKGVCWDKAMSKWLVTLKVNKKHKTIGRFKDPLKAAKAYDRAALIHRGKFACTNKSLGLLPAE